MPGEWKILGIKMGDITVKTSEKGGEDERVSKFTPTLVRLSAHEGKVRVALIPTAANTADLFTKVLDNATFARHRATVYNLAARPDASRAEAEPASKASKPEVDKGTSES